MVSTEDKTDSTTIPYQNTDNERKKRYLLIGTVFICYALVYLIVILLSITTSKPILNLDSSTLKAEAILLDASVLSYNFNKTDFKSVAKDNNTKDKALIGHDLYDQTGNAQLVSDMEKSKILRKFYIDYSLAFEIDIEKLFQIYNNAKLDSNQRLDEVKELMKEDKAIYKLTKLYGVIEHKYFDLVGKEDKSKTKTKTEIQEDIKKKKTEICTICEEALNKWFNNFDKMSRLKIYTNKEDSPNNDDFADKWYLGFATTFGNYGKEFPGIVGTIQSYLITVANIWDKEIYKDESKKGKRTEYKPLKDLEEETK